MGSEMCIRDRYKVPITDDTATPPTASTTALVKSILVSEDSNNADTITITITRDNIDSDPVFSVFKDKAVGAKGTVELLTQPLGCKRVMKLKLPLVLRIDYMYYYLYWRLHNGNEISP